MFRLAPSYKGDECAMCRNCMIARCPLRNQYPAGTRGRYMYHLRIWQETTEGMLRAMAMKLLGEEVATKFVVCLFIDLAEAIPIICHMYVKDFDDTITRHNQRINPQGMKRFAFVAFKEFVSSATIESVVALDADSGAEYEKFAGIENCTPEEIVAKINEEARKACEM